MLQLGKVEHLKLFRYLSGIVNIQSSEKSGVLAVYQGIDNSMVEYHTHMNRNNSDNNQIHNKYIFCSLL